MMDTQGSVSRSHSRAWKDIPLAICLAVVFVSFSALRLIGDSDSIVGSQAALQSVLTGPILHTKLARNIALFVSAHVLLTVLFGLICWAAGVISESAWRTAGLSRRAWVLIWSVLGWASVLVANAAMYPWSLLGEPYAGLATIEWRGISLFELWSVLVLGFAGASILRVAWRTHAQSSTLIRLGVTSSALAAALLIAPFGESRTPTLADTQRPNIIIIGIDALRHDAPFGGIQENLTPAIDNFLQQAVRFPDTTTPLARTFPSWVATLTGRHPHTTGAVINLIPPNMICMGQTLPHTLQAHGYTTVYAIDEVRFSNVDESYGFDRTITPPIGASDFLLGSLNDTPLSNLVVNIRLGRWLFSFSHANRASAVTYKPAVFVQRLKRELPRKRPLFLAAHLTLAHWPYYWADSPMRDLVDVSSLQGLYAMSVREVDRQFASVMDTLEALGLLQNAIVVLMSDHGESLGRSNDNPYGRNDPNLRGVIRLGHGTSVLSPQQYRVVLGIRRYGETSSTLWRARTIDAPVTLTDLSPTLLDLLDIPGQRSSDGRSLLGLLANEPSASQIFATRTRFTESEFNPRGFQPGMTLTASALAEIATFYELDPETDRILVKAERLRSVLKDRQYAALRGNHILAAVPNSEEGGFRYIWADRTGGVTRAIDPEAEDEEKIRGLLQALQQQFSGVLVDSRKPLSDDLCEQ